MAEEKDSDTETAPMNFYEGMSSDELANWLNVELKKSNQTLTPSMKRKLIQHQINGKAFKNLKECHLKDMKFDIGCISTIMNIITEVCRPPKMSCSMPICPTLTALEDREPLPEGRFHTLACVPHRSRFWGKKKLTVQFCGKKKLYPKDMSVEEIFDCANKWSKGDIKGEANYIPKFIQFKRGMRNLMPDIKVYLNKKGLNQTTPIGYSKKSKVDIDLIHHDLRYRKHLIVHEFGHVLGLAHEHQRSKFWDFIRSYIDMEAIKKDIPGRMGSYEEFLEIDESESSETYDPDSVMHYWFKKEWLMKGYSDEKKVDEDRHLHSPELHAVLKGVHKRQTLAQLPSSGDLTFLSNKYCEIFKEQTDGQSDYSNDPRESESQSPGQGPPLKEELNGNKLIFYLKLALALVIVLVAVCMAIVIPFFLKEETESDVEESHPTIIPSPNMTPSPKACREMVYADVRELAQTIETYGSAKEWCLYLRISQSTCNRLDYSRQHLKHTILDVAQAYLNEKLSPCWEEIVRVLCRDFRMNKPAIKLAQKHGIDFATQCTV